ncbi:hypothetical protein [Paracoccus ravus]|uniref:hypothetical protein n=1 Tax=Paracoccus ravus TaxID=2447760 RepID=UPI00106E411F|nr:hypothetical protein [Paracoccus ravus]
MVETDQRERTTSTYKSGWNRYVRDKFGDRNMVEFAEQHQEVRLYHEELTATCKPSGPSQMLRVIGALYARAKKRYPKMPPCAIISPPLPQRPTRSNERS